LSVAVVGASPVSARSPFTRRTSSEQKRQRISAFASILCALIAIPIGVLGWRLAKGRSQQPVLGQAAGLIGGGTLAASFVALVYVLSQDTP